MRKTLHKAFLVSRLCALLLLLILVAAAAMRAQESAPVPLLKQGQPVDWWFVFKFNAGALPGCGGEAQRVCTFGGTVQSYPSFSQQFAFASSDSFELKQGSGCVGETGADPLGATFEQVYNGKRFYVVWNDQFDGNPIATKGAPAGHSKGLLAWDNDGNGLVLQVSTPSWPASGSASSPRKNDGNTLGCVTDNDVLVSQHFFALKLNKDDVIAVLKALQNASVVTDPAQPQLASNGGPPEVQALVKTLGKPSKSKTATSVKLSSGVQLISKPSGLHVPPWQMVSALLGGEPLRAATWWHSPEIPTTAADTSIGCWDASLGKPGAVEIATSGTWDGKSIGLQGIAAASGNHAKVGVSTGTHTYAIFGDMNQQGSIAKPNCASSQNGRGGLFYVVDNPQLFESVRDLLKGDTAPAK
ncbi:MAG: deoxyribonuclease II family protein [Bryobacteraceae bacterium]|nr:deoxyribonuclease II family protein [Bryobacteraceae bacterium]